MDSPFFIASKIFWFLARPENWVVALLLLAAIAFRRGRYRSGKAWLRAGIATILIVGILPVGEALLLPLEQRFPVRPPVAAPVGIIVLGGAEDGRRTQATGLPEVSEAAERFLAGIALARTYPEALLIFSGGSGALLGEGASGADVAAEIFRESGVAAERVLLEGASRNTAENAAKTRDLVDTSLDGPWLLVTSAFHMPRAVGTFCAAGWQNIVPYPVDYRAVGEVSLGWDLAGNLSTLDLAVKEWIGLFAYRLTGRTEALLADGCQTGTR